MPLRSTETHSPCEKWDGGGGIGTRAHDSVVPIWDLEKLLSGGISVSLEPSHLKSRDPISTYSVMRTEESWGGKGPVCS